MEYGNMKIIIEGINGTEICTPTSKDINRRRFFERNGMLYRAYPEQLSRMRITHYGVRKGTDTVIFYQENAIRPMLERGDVITVDKLLADIDENKIVTPGKMNRKAWGNLTVKNRKTLTELIPFILIGAILLYSFGGNGFQL